MPVKKIIAYSGEIYTIEWYLDVNGKSPAREYYDALSPQQQDKLMYLFQLLADTGKIRSEEKFRFEWGQNFCLQTYAR